MSETHSRSQDDYIMAALTHLAVILPLWGLVAAIVIWATQKDKSRFIAFQALQSMIYQVLPIFGFVAFFFCYTCSFAGTFLIIPVGALMAEGGGEGAETALAVLVSMLSMGLPFAVFGVAALIWLGYIVYAVYAAIRVFQRHDFRYAVIGAWLERYLNRAETAGDSL
ncbi:MAG: DUF4870 domain-containing protein [Anaerolineae bacterium]|nr:DUF4870 domain-containing protein [Anaerolineae bacterium]